MPQRQCVTFMLIAFSTELSLYANYHLKPNIRPVIVEIIVRFSAHGLYHRGMAILWPWALPLGDGKSLAMGFIIGCGKSLAMGFIIGRWQFSGHGLYDRGMASLWPWALS